jgi:hypothetical protein
MANQIAVNVYQINQNVLQRDQSMRFGFPSAGISLQDVTGSPTRSLSSGYNVYGLITTVADGKQYYVGETLAALVTLANA